MIAPGSDREALKFKEKRRWQIALRRYVIESQLCPAYAPYFGIDIRTFRQWIEMQFEDGTGWDNFGKNWQLDHIIPIAYFDTDIDQELRLCWNFINIRVANTQSDRVEANRVDVFTAKTYFKDMFNSTGYPISNEMIRKIEKLERSVPNSRTNDFIQRNLSHLTAVAGFTEYEFMKLNSGVQLKEIIQEKAMLEKFGK